MSKTAISAKLEDQLLKKTDELAEKFNIARNRAVEEGLQLWVDLKSRELLAIRMKEASLATRKESRESAQEWENALNDGLAKEK